jgi:tetratricopeptide (TPR) repeat protein
MTDIEIAKQLFADGLDLIKNNQFEQAENKFLKSLELIPDRESVLNNLSSAQIKLKKFQDAKKSAAKVVELNKNNAVAWMNLGVIEQELNNYESSINYFNKAIEIDPLYFHAYNNRGILLCELRKYKEAIINFDKSLELKPDLLEAALNKADAFKELKNFNKALECIDTALKIKNFAPETWGKKGDILHNMKRYDEAIQAYDQAIKLNKNYAEAFCNKGFTLFTIERYEESIASNNKALEIKKIFPEAWVNIAVSYISLKKYELALDYCEKALAVSENFIEALNSKGLCLFNLKRYEEANKIFDKILKIKKDFPEAIENKANTLHALKEYDKALIFYDSIKTKKDYHKVLNNKGLLLHALGHTKDKKYFELAKNCYDQAIKIKPDFANTYWNKSLTQLTLGEFESGWKNYEYRFKLENAKSQFTIIPRLESLKNLANKRVLIWSEQGLGDSIQFCRYIYKIIDLGTKVTFDISKTLTALMSRQFNCAINETGQGLIQKDFDFQIPLLSLPMLFNTDLNNIPFNNAYLKTSKSKDVEWFNKLKLTKQKLNIAITYAGNPDYLLDSERSANLEIFYPLINKANLFLIQKEMKKEDEIFLKKYPQINFIGKNIDNFDDLASVIQNMDLVISTDTSIPHLAASIGKRVFILLGRITDWRWSLNSKTSPWYSSATLLRKKFNPKTKTEDWSHAFDEIMKELKIN